MLRATFLLAVAWAANNAGDPSCPCLTKVGNAALFGDISTRLAAAGYSGAEGLRGCESYSTTSNSSQMWCFVDPRICAEDEGACIKAGGQPGSESYPEPCRSREMIGSSLIRDASVSYATCGNLNPRRNPTVALHNRTFKVIVQGMPYEEYSGSIQGTAQQFHGLSGVGIEVWLAVIADRNITTIPVLERNITPLLSPQGKAVSSSRATRGIYDIGVGRYDLGLVTYLVTPG